MHSYKLEDVGQAVCNTFVGQWFLFGIQAAARNCRRLHYLHSTSTPYRRDRVAEQSPITREKFTVWQMTLPSNADISFIPVINHLRTGNKVYAANSSLQLELSLNASVLASVVENSATESVNCVSQLCLSCDERNCSTDQSSEAAVIMFTPLTSTYAASRTIDGSCLKSHVHSSSSHLSHISSSQCVSPDIVYNNHHKANVESELDSESSSFTIEPSHFSIKKRIPSSELFDITDDSCKFVANIEESYV